MRRIADEYGIAALSAAALVGPALAGGGYGAVARHAGGLIVWLVVLGLLFARARAALPRGPVLVVTWTIVAFAAITGLSMLWSESAGRSYDELTRVLTYLGVFIAVAAVGRDARRRGQLLEGLTLGMVLVVIIAVLSRIEPGLFHDQALQRFAPEFRPRLAYPFGYWNALGSFAAVAIVLLVHAASRADRSAWYRGVATAMLPVAGIALYLTFSRGSIVAAAVGCALVLWLSPRRLPAFGATILGLAGTTVLVVLVRSYPELNDGLIDGTAARAQGHRVLVALLVVGALAFAARLAAERAALPRHIAAAISAHGRVVGIGALVLVLAASVASAPKIADRIGEFNDPVVFQSAGSATQDVQGRLTSGSANGRYQFWASSWDAWQTRPVAGRGAGTWEFWWRRNATINAPTRDAHSLFFDVLAELGTLGVLALSGVLGSVLWFCFAAVRMGTAAARPGLVAIAAAVVTWTIGASIDWIWEFGALGAVLFGLAALGVAARRDQLAPAGAREPARSGRHAVATLGIGAWAATIVLGVALTASWSIDRSEDALARGDLEGAEDAANLARKVEPWASEPYMQRALVRVRIETFPAAIADARTATEKDPTNWRTWLTLTRVEARAGRIDAAVRDNAQVTRLAKGSPLIPTYQQLLDISTSKDLSLSPGQP